MTTAPAVRAAVVQATPLLFDTPATLDKVAKLCADAAKEGSQLVVFPEALLGGYPKGLDFGARVGMRQHEGREQYLRYWEAAIEVPSKTTRRLGEVARELGQYVVIGVVEREAGTLYCTALFFDPEAGLVGLHRKLVPTAMERLIWGNGDGSTMPVLDTPLGRIGAVICWENYMPLLRMHMYGQGIQLYCAPTVDDRETWFPTMRHVALEGRCFVLSACQYLQRSDYPEGAEPAAGEDTSGEIMIRGGSCIIDPLGQVLAGPSYGKEVILTAELDLTQIVRGKYDLDVTGHYARPDIFRLEVDDRPRPAVALGPTREAPELRRWLRAETEEGEEPSTTKFRKSQPVPRRPLPGKPQQAQQAQQAPRAARLPPPVPEKNEKKEELPSVDEPAPEDAAPTIPTLAPPAPVPVPAPVLKPPAPPQPPAPAVPPAPATPPTPPAEEEK